MSLSTDKSERVFHQLIADIYSCHTLDDLATITCENINKVISGNSAVWNIHGEKPVVFKCITAEDFVDYTNEFMDVINHTIMTHPIVNSLQLYPKVKSLSDGVHQIKSVCTDHVYKETAVYRNAYRKMHTEDQLLTQLYLGNDFGIALSINTDKKFNESDIKKAETIRFHLINSIHRIMESEKWNDLSYKRDQFCLFHRVYLTPRQKEVFNWVVEAKTHAEIAIILSTKKKVTKKAVDQHVEAIRKAFDLESIKILIKEFCNFNLLTFQKK